MKHSSEPTVHIDETSVTFCNDDSRMRYASVNARNSFKIMWRELLWVSYIFHII